MDKLKPCPFCGKSVATVGTVAEHDLTDEYLPEYGWSTTHYDVVCSALFGGCGASTGKDNETAEKAIEVWNRRAAVRNADGVEIIPLGALLSLRDELYDYDEISIGGLMRLNKLISEHRRADDAESIDGRKN